MMIHTRPFGGHPTQAERILLLAWSHWYAGGEVSIAVEFLHDEVMWS